MWRWLWLKFARMINRLAHSDHFRACISRTEPRMLGTVGSQTGTNKPSVSGRDGRTHYSFISLRFACATTMNVVETVRNCLGRWTEGGEGEWYAMKLVILRYCRLTRV